MLGKTAGLVPVCGYTASDPTRDQNFGEHGAEWAGEAIIDDCS